MYPATLRIRRVFAIAIAHTHIIAAKIYVSPLNLCYKLRQLYVYYVRNNRLLLLPTANCQLPAGNRADMGGGKEE